jgi:PAS domain S-box-containing protein
MKTKILNLIDFQKVDALLEGFNKTTGFVTAILDLEGNVLSKSGWREICTGFHRLHPLSSERCKISDTVLAGKMEAGEKFHFYQCLNGLIDVAVPIEIKGQHIANLFSGQFFFEKPDVAFFENQAELYGYNKEVYLEALEKVPVVSKEKVLEAMNFLLSMTQMISEMTFQKLEQRELTETIQKDERILRLFVEHSPASIAMFDNDMRYIIASQRFLSDYKLGNQNLTGRSHYEVFPEMPENWKEIHRRCLAGETISESNDSFPRADGTIDWVRWEIRPWYEDEDQIGGIILFSEVITEFKKAEQEKVRLLESEKEALAEANSAKVQLAQILDRISDGFGSLDRNWNYTYVNEKLAQNVGKKREELLGQNIWKVFPEAIGSEVHQAYLQSMEEQVVIDLEHFYSPFGKWFLHRFYPSPDGLSVFSRDITESKIAEEKIRENSSLVRIAAEKAKLGGWNVILGENRSYWSDEVAAIHEMPPGYAPLVEDGINFYAPEYRDRIIKVFTDCVQKGIPYDEEMQIITSTGKRVWIRTIGEAVRDENGKIYKVQGGFQDISEKKIAEEKSREKDLQFRKLSANLPDLIFQFTRRPDGSYCVPIASEGIKNIFGCTPEDVVDDFTAIAKVLHPDDAERVIADIEYSATHLSYFTCEFRVIIPGRPVQWIFSRSTPERLPDGSITWYGFNANITQRKEYENALRESEEKFRKIYQEGPFGMALVNKEYKFIMANRKFCDITGFSESELTGLTFRDITYSEDMDKGMSSIRKLVKGELPVVRLEKRYVRKDGKVIWGAITVTAYFDKEGNYLYNLSILEDITRRKEDQEQIERLNERLQLLVEAIQELSISTSLENIMTTVRSHVRKLVNADGSTFILRQGDSCYYADEDTISPLWKGQSFPMTNCISGWAMLNKQSVVIDDIYTDSRIPVELYKSTFVRSLSISPIRINDPLGAIGAYWSRNYSPTEVEIKLLNTLADAAAKAVENIQLIEGLEHKIQERTSQLQAVNKELETFTYSVSHDLKAPLRGIDGYSKLLADLHSRDLNEEAKYFISTIRSSTQLMSRLIEDLLQYSRLERSQLRSEPVMIKALVEAILKINESEINTHHFTVKIEIADSPVMADSNGIQMALRNLIENAIKFTKSVPEPTIEIKQTETDLSWTLSVKDNGIGFDMKYSHRIFEIFQRLHRVEDYQGTGIGLAIVSKAMHRMNGKAWAESTPGQGSTFFIEIPKPISNGNN